MRLAGTFLGLAIAGAGAAMAQEGGATAQPQSKAVDYLSNLNAAKLGKLFEHLKIQPSPEFLNCLCPQGAGFHYYVGPEGGPCRRIGPLGGLEFRDFDSANIASCSAAYPLSDGRTVLDAVTSAAATAPISGQPEPGEAQVSVCRAVISHWTRRRDDLRTRVDHGRAELRAWEAHQQEMSEEEIRTGQWVFGWLGPDGKPHPGPALASINQDIGALECVQTILDDCEATVNRYGGEPKADASPSDGEFRAEFDQYAAQLSAKYGQRAQEQFDLSLKRKQLFEGNPYDYRLGTEANQLAGYAEACREAAAHLDGLRSSTTVPVQAPTSDTSGDQ